MKRQVIVIIIAIMFALMTTGIIFKYVKNYESRVLQESKSTVNVVIAAKEIRVGTQINASMLTTMEWPKKKVLDAHITDTNAVIGKYVKTNVPKDMPIMAEFLLKKGADVSHFVPEKMRAMTLRFSEKNGDIMFVRPGSRVDILATFNQRGEGSSTRTILQNVQAIAVNGKTQESFDPKENEIITSVTILVPPSDTQKLALAKSQGVISVVLRNQNDQAVMDEEEQGALSMIFSRLSGDKNDADMGGAPMPRAAIQSVTIIRGTEVSHERLR